MITVEQLWTKEEQVAVVGLGYVGLPLAKVFSKYYRVIGFDEDLEKIRLYQGQASEAFYPTGRADDLKCARFFIIAVPTPAGADRKPDLSCLIRASETVGARLRRGSVVVYESTVYPGTTETVCVPILERASGLRCGVEFFVGYSPERVNPGDPAHPIEEVVKVVSGMDARTAGLLSQVYGRVIPAGVYQAPNIMVAEAAKMFENVQRDVNIGLINELSALMDAMNIDTHAVVEAASTKWNYSPYQPGLVGGHCIGVDSLYLLDCAQRYGCRLRVLEEARRSNLAAPARVALRTSEQIEQLGLTPSSARVAVAGFTFKEDVADIRNTGVMEVIEHLRALGIQPVVADPQADSALVRRVYGIELIPFALLQDLDVLVIAVRHREYRQLTPERLDLLFRCEKRALIDVKGIFDQEEMRRRGYLYWRM